MAYLDIIFWLCVVVVVFMRLKNLLGTRPENERVIVLNKDKMKEIIDVLEHEVKNIEPAEILPLEGVDAVLAQIPDFRKDVFLKGATRAFEIIVTAFAEADLETLGALTTKKIFKKFADIIAERKSLNQTAETDVISVKAVEIKEAKLLKNQAKIMVRFSSEQVNLLKNADGEVVQGDENFVQTIDDFWTFERDLNKMSNIWLLSSTKK